MSVIPVVGVLLWAVLTFLLRCLLDRLAGQKRPVLYHSLAQMPAAVYQVACIGEYLRHKRLDVLGKRMIFSIHHVQGIWPDEVRRLWSSLLAVWALLVFYALFPR